MKDWIELLLIIIGLINAIIIPWGIWVTSSIYQLKSGLALNQAADEERVKYIGELKTMIEKLGDKLEKLIDEIHLLEPRKR